MRKTPEVGPHNISDIEQDYDVLDIKTKLARLYHRGMHRHFGHNAEDGISGRPIG